MQKYSEMGLKASLNVSRSVTLVCGYIFPAFVLIESEVCDFCLTCLSLLMRTLDVTVGKCLKPFINHKYNVMFYKHSLEAQQNIIPSILTPVSPVIYRHEKGEMCLLG